MHNLFLATVLMTSLSVSAATFTNPLLAEWTGPYGGVPPLDKVKVADMKTGIEEGMELQRKEIQAIANNPEPATFENTFLAMEKAGAPLERVLAIYFTWSSSMNTPEFQALDQEMAPKLAAFMDEITQNSKLFQRIEAVYNSTDKAKLTPEQQRLVWSSHVRFVLRGAKLDDKQKKRVADVNQRLAVLQTKFAQNLMGDEGEGGLTIEKQEDLKGLPQSLIDGYAEEAAKRKMTGKWFVANTRSSMEPFVTYSPNRELREKAFRIWTSRGDTGNKYDNNKNIAEIMKLRTEKAKLLGYPTYAAWSMGNTMAKEPQAAMDLMMAVWKPATEAVKKDVAEMQAIVDKEKGGFKIEPWDYRYYAEQVRKAKYDFDFDLVKPYLQLDNLRDGMFLAAGKLFNMKFKKVNGIPVFHKDMTVYEVTKNGKVVGLWYFDPFARTGKRSGAWMSGYREQSKIDGKPVITLVSNNSNFIPGKPGEPVLLSWDDARTMFHEFGHALHGLNSDVTYKSLSGTSTLRDFVEFPSQFYEHYLTTPEVLALLKNKQGKPLPKNLIAKINKTEHFNQGFSTVEYLSSAILDMKLHMVGDKKIDAKNFEKETLAEIGMPKEIVMRHRLPQFNHLFSDEAYAAGYYSYLWAEVLNHDAYGAFTEAKNPYDKKTAKKLNDFVFSIGNTMDPADAFRKFRGRDPEVRALLKSRGFEPAAASVQ